MLTIQRDARWGTFTRRRAATSDQLGNGRRRASTTEVCDYLGVSRRTLQRYEDDPNLNFPPPIVIRGRKKYDPEQIELFEARRRTIAEHKAAERRAAVIAEAAKAAAAEAKAEAAVEQQPRRGRGRPRKAAVDNPKPRRPRGRPRMKRVLSPRTA
jgi:hypothetical protein